MNQVVFLLLRRMRMPLLVLIVTYAISILGLVLMPGTDDAGKPWQMDFFHAFYVISYTATTIGFGEIPYPFSDAQRFWMIFSIHITVIAWLYAIGKILTLMQDPAFRQAVTEHAFARGVRRITEPFYIVCGYGDTGGLLVSALAQRNMRAVVVDINQDRINALELEDLDIYMPGLCADASLPITLEEAGLLHTHCVGVVALTDSDEVNLKIAITTKLMHPGIQVICRAETIDAEKNMRSFGTDHVINPFDTFAARLALALHSPGTHLLHEWLTGVPSTPLSSPLYPPHGLWILCGYGRFGKAVHANFRSEGINVVIIEADPEGTGCHTEQCVVGRGTESDTLLAARVEEAAGLVAGTDNDVNNLSIIVTAREHNPQLFSVARQNRRDNGDIFRAAHLDLVMQRSEIIARDILGLLTTPLLDEFLLQSRCQNSAWANELVSRISAVTNEVVPDVWSVTLDEREAPAVIAALKAAPLSLAVLLHAPRNRQQRLSCLPLLLKRQGEVMLIPEEEAVLQQGDQLLFCGVAGAHTQMQWALQNHNALRYLQSGVERPAGFVWQWLTERFAGERRGL